MVNKISQNEENNCNISRIWRDSESILCIWKTIKRQNKLQLQNQQSCKYKLRTMNDALKYYSILEDSTNVFLNNDKPRFAEINFLNF